MHTTMAIELRFWWCCLAKLGPQSLVRRLDTLATFFYRFHRRPYSRISLVLEVLQQVLVLFHLSARLFRVPEVLHLELV
uniref:Putative secreted protein n=1 Tax=Anopheles darlingi TaxID=43151 RepID=A0A2M4DR88_ANODA